MDKILYQYYSAIVLILATNEIVFYKTKTVIQKDICLLMFIAALITIAKIWMQPKCPLIDEWIKKMWYMYTMDYSSHKRKNKILTLAKTWVDLEGIMLSEINQTEKDKYCMISIIYGI